MRPVQQPTSVAGGRHRCRRRCRRRRCRRRRYSLLLLLRCPSLLVDGGGGRCHHRPFGRSSFIHLHRVRCCRLRQCNSGSVLTCDPDFFVPHFFSSFFFFPPSPFVRLFAGRRRSLLRCRSSFVVHRSLFIVVCPCHVSRVPNILVSRSVSAVGCSE